MQEKSPAHIEHAGRTAPARGQDAGRIVRLSVVAFAVLLSQGVVVSQPTLDILIRNGRVVDGTGSPWYIGDIGIVDGRIAAIGKLNMPAKSAIDASNLVVAPGFIDMLGLSLDKSPWWFEISNLRFLCSARRSYVTPC